MTNFNQYFLFHLEIHWRFQIWYRILPKMTIWTIKSNFLVYWPISTIFFPFTRKFIGDYKSNIVVYPKWLFEPLNPTFLFISQFQQIFFPFTWKFIGDYKSDIVVYPKWLFEPLNPTFLFISQFQQIFFPFTWKFIGDYKSDIVVYLKWLPEPLNPTSLFMDWFQPFFFFYLEIHWRLQIWYRSLPRLTLWTTKLNFLVYGLISTNKNFFHQENHWRF